MDRKPDTANQRLLKMAGFQVIISGLICVIGDNEIAREHAEALRGRTAMEVPQLLRTPPNSLLEIIHRKANEQLPADATQLAVQCVLGFALASALIHGGWAAQSAPGAKVLVRRGGQAIDPFEQLSKLAAGSISEDHWRQWCAEAGIEKLALARSSEAVVQ